MNRLRINHHLKRGDLDHARIAEELPQVRAQGPGGGGVRGAELDEEDARGAHARKLGGKELRPGEGCQR